MKEKKAIVAYATVTKTQSVLVLLDPETMKGGVYSPGITKEVWSSLDVKEGEFYPLTLEQVIHYRFNNRFITFGRSDQTYLIREMTEGTSQEKLFFFYNKLVNEFVPGFKINPKPKNLFGNFELENILKQGTLPEEVLSRLGASIEPLGIDPLASKDLNNDEKRELVDFTIQRAIGISKVFNHPFTKGAYKQAFATIEQYLGGQEYYFSQNGSKLATSALTQSHIKGKKPFVNKKSDKINWIFNGVNVLDVIPSKEWKDAIISYTKELEDAYQKYLTLITGGATEREAGAVFKSIPFPSVNFSLSENVSVQSSGGGLHMRHNQNVIRRSNVHHHDIEGAYTAMILSLGVFSPEIESIYKGFKKDKFSFKKLKKIMNDLLDSGSLIVSEVVEKAKDLGIKFNPNLSVGELIDEIEKGVAASKLATNKPTGIADQVGTPLFNPLGMIEARITLQIALCDLALRIINASGEVLSINTDGLFWCDNGVVNNSVVEEWSKFWGLEIGYDFIPNYIAKSDNDRLIYQGDLILEAAGDDLVHQSFSNFEKLGTKPLVVDRVIAKKLIHPEKSLKELLEDEVNKNSVDAFAFTSKAQRNSKPVINLQVASRVNRFFLTKSGDTIETYIIKTEALGKLINVPNSPVRVFNKSLPEKLPEDLNLDAYLDLIENVYSHWQE